MVVTAACGLVHGVGQRVGQVTLDDLVHAVVQGGGEEQALALAGGHVHELLDHRQEAEVGHVVGLVQDGDLDAFEGQDALADQVLQAARAGDDDVDAGAQGLFLAGLGDAAVDHGGGQAHGLGHRLDGGVDLGGQLTGRCEDQAHGAAGLAEVLGFPLGESCHKRDGESDGLAGAGAAAAQDVASCQGVREGLDLDGERLHDPLGGEGVGEGLGRAEGSKSSHMFQRSFRRYPCGYRPPVPVGPGVRRRKVR